MQLWRAKGTVWALLALGLVAGCGSDGGGGGGGEGDDASADSGGPERDTGTPGGGDAGMDSAMTECMPKGCQEFEAANGGLDPKLSCGEVPDGCGGTVPCGDCSQAGAYLTCGGSGQANVCGCTPKSCEEQSSTAGAKVCGDVGDGCGGALDCGACAGEHDSCGGAGTPNVCGCAPNPLACGERQCGTAPDGCGGTVQCGSQNGQCSAARECNDQGACVCATQAAAACAGKCGRQVVDGCTFECPACNTACSSGGACTDCACPAGPAEGAADDEICQSGTCCKPDALAVTCGAAQCGSKVNNCGQTVQCGACGAGSACYSGKCVDARKVAMVGDYAVRNESFAIVATLMTRNESINRMRITLNDAGELEYRESSCSVTGYQRGSNSPIAFVGPATSSKIEEKSGKLEIPPSVAGLQGTPDWFREKHAPASNTLGWRRGRPSFCPAPTAANPLPSPDPTLPGYAPANDVYAKGSKKPWLKGADCKCPERELSDRRQCRSGTAAQQQACKESWANDVIPVKATENAGGLDVTDCRVIDEDQDGQPGISIEASALGLGGATLRSASVSSVRFWGQVDLVNRRHTGVSEDQVETGNSVLACTVTGGLGGLLCGATEGDFCRGYVQEAGETYRRSNLLDFVPLTGEWDCEKIYDNRAGLFREAPVPTFPTSNQCLGQ